MNPDAFRAVAESLYGGTTTQATPVLAPADTAAPAPTASTEAEAEFQALADGLYDKPVAEIKPELPPGIAEMRTAEENGPYSRIGGYDSMPIEAAMEGLDLPAETLVAAATEFRHMAVDLGASADQASQFLATVQGFVANPPTPEQSARMQGEAAALVVAQYGEDATKMLDLAKCLVQRDPRISSMLERTGAGNDPRTVMSLIERAVQQRTRGRLK